MDISRGRTQGFFSVYYIDFPVHSIQESSRSDFINLLDNILNQFSFGFFAVQSSGASVEYHIPEFKKLLTNR